MCMRTLKVCKGAISQCVRESSPRYIANREQKVKSIFMVIYNLYDDTVKQSIESCSKIENTLSNLVRNIEIHRKFQVIFFQAYALKLLYKLTVDVESLRRIVNTATAPFYIQITVFECNTPAAASTITFTIIQDWTYVTIFTCYMHSLLIYLLYTYSRKK